MSLAALAPVRRPAPPVVAPISYPSPEARAFYFAVCRDAFLNLPRAWAEQFPSERALRQHCLVRAGHCTHTDIVYASPEAALQASVLVKPEKGDDYVLATAFGDVVSILRPKSQSAKALPAREFFDLRDKVFAILADMLGVDPVTLLRQAGRSA